jgi:phosphate transport system substrate-binding protein
MLRSIVRRTAAALFVVSMAAPAMAATQLTGAGSTFVYPFFSKAFYDYSQSHADVTVNYQSIGSGGGIQQFTAKTVDFGASDVPMNADELARAKDAVVQFPIALGGVAISYNIPVQINGGLKLTRALLADIYLGKITKWNDSQLGKLNPGVALPDMPIVVAHRSDGSGTTYIFTDFLSHVSPEWKSKVGTGKDVQWPAPAAIGGKGNEGVAGVVKQTPGAIGYLELAYVIENKMAAAQLQNVSGKFVTCTATTVAAAAATKPTVSASDFSIVDAKAPDAYPIAGYVWVMVYENPSDKARAKLVRDVLQWAATSGQQVAGTLNYVPLPQNVQGTAKRSLALVKV